VAGDPIDPLPATVPPATVPPATVPPSAARSSTADETAPLHELAVALALNVVADRLDHTDRRLETIEHTLADVLKAVGGAVKAESEASGEAKVIDARARAAWQQAIIDCPGRVGGWANGVLEANPALRVAATGVLTAILGAATVKSPDILAAILAILQHRAGTP
jgi:hypothetical protein